MTRRHHILIATTIVFTACQTPPGLDDIEEVPTAQILDAAHNDGRAGFYFLPPLVPDPGASGEFDPAFLPFLAVEVCEWDGAACVGDPVGSFTSEEGTGSEVLRIGDDNEHYIVNWHTKNDDFDPDKDYRIRVLAGEVELGHADVDVVSRGRELKNVDTGEFIALKNGRTLPIKFRIDTQLRAVQIIGAAGGEITSDNGAATLTVPAGAVPQETVLAIAVAPEISILPELRAAGYQAVSPEVILDPDGVEFAEPVQLRISYDESLIPGNRDENELHVVQFDEDGNLIDVEPVIPSPADNTVLALLTHFSGAQVTVPPSSLVYPYKWNVDELRYFIDNDQLGFLWGTSETLKSAVRRAVESWEAHQGRFHIREVFDEAQAHLVLKTTTSILGGALGRTNIFAFRPRTLDDNDQIVIEFASSQKFANGYYSFGLELGIETVVRHEIGHGLGLIHYTRQPSQREPVGIPAMWIAFPFGSGFDEFQRTITGDDIAALQHHYHSALRMAGGTYFDRDFGLIGTAFEFDPVTRLGIANLVSVEGPAGWNSGVAFPCGRFQPPGTASNRALCWNVAIPPVSGFYQATGSFGTKTLIAGFEIDAGSHLDPPLIVGVQGSSNEVTIDWQANSASRSFLVRVNPLPFTGVSGEEVVGGSVRTATLSSLSLTPGQPHQAVVFAFNADVMSQDPIPVQFNIGAQGVVFTPALPGGHEILFSSSVDGSPDTWAIKLDGTGRMNLSRVSHDPNSVFEDGGGRWSPDGSQIPFTSNKFPGVPRKAFVMDADGSDAHPLNNNANTEVDPFWGPDGTKVYYGRNPTFPATSGAGCGPCPFWEIYEYDLITGQETRLTTNNSRDEHAVASSDGSLIAFRRAERPNDCCNPTSVWIMDANGQNQRRISPNNNQYETPLDWDPVNNKILTAWSSAVVLMDPDGTAEQLTTGATGAAFFPDGSTILLAKDADIYFLDIATRQITPFLVEPGAQHPSDWRGVTNTTGLARNIAPRTPVGVGVVGPAGQDGISSFGFNPLDLESCGIGIFVEEGPLLPGEPFDPVASRAMETAIRRSRLRSPSLKLPERFSRR